jgi:phosphonate transport system substrate-binding protein
MRLFTVGATLALLSSPARGETITLGLTRPIGAKAAASAAQQAPPYLSKATGHTVKAKLFTDYMELSDALALGRVDVAWATPVAYARATLFGKPAALAQAVRRGQTHYLSVLFTRKDGPVKALGDARGMRMAWVEKGSATGYVVPRAMLMAVFINPEMHFTEQLYFPDHALVCKAVRDGKADVGATFMDPRPAGEAQVVDGCREALGEADDFAVLRASEPVPNDVVAAREGLDGAVAESFRAALLGMAEKPEGKKLLKDVFRAERFAAPETAPYGKLRGMLPREVRIPPADVTVGK